MAHALATNCRHIKGERIMALKIQIHEQAAKKYEYIPIAYNLEDEIFCHCSYFLVFNMPQTDNHWKQDVYSFVKKIKAMKVKSGSKAEYTETALVELSHGKHFCEDREETDKVFEKVYNREDSPHPFDFDMTLSHNQAVYFDALDKFYYAFLIPWIAIPDKEPPREPLYKAIDKYLITRRKEMVSK